MREWRDRPGSPLGGYFESVRDWWEEIPDVHGDVRIYTRDEDAGNDGNEWVEFRIRFTHGRVERVDTVQTGSSQRGSHGLINSTRPRWKSATLRVATTSPWTTAVAAISASRTGAGSGTW